MIESASKGLGANIEPYVKNFEQFYRENYRSVVTLVYILTGSKHGAEDIAQDAFLQTHRRWSEVGRYDRPDGWVRVVAMNLARSRARRFGAEARALARVAGLARTAFPDLEPHNERFWQAVRGLPRRQREVVALHYLEDRSVADVAVILGIAESTVKNSLAQGRQHLVRTLEVSL